LKLVIRHKKAAYFFILGLLLLVIMVSAVNAAPHELNVTLIDDSTDLTVDIFTVSALSLDNGSYEQKTSVLVNDSLSDSTVYSGTSLNPSRSIATTYNFVSNPKISNVNGQFKANTGGGTVYLEVKFYYQDLTTFTTTTYTTTSSSYVPYTASGWDTNKGISKIEILIARNGAVSSVQNTNNVVNYSRGIATFDLVHGNFTVTLNDSSYSLSSTNITLPTSPNFTTYNFQGLGRNTFNLSFYNETSNTILNNLNITVNIISLSNAANYTTDSGSLEVSLLTPDDYAIEYYSNQNVRRYFYLTLSNGSYENIKLYLIDEDVSDYYVPVFTDGSGSACQEHNVSLLRYYTQDNSYSIVQMAQTDQQGQAVLRVQPNVIPYKIIVSGSCGSYTTLPTNIVTTSDSYTVLSAQSVLESFNKIGGVSRSLTYNNATFTFVYTWTDTQNLITQGCLQVTRIMSGRRQIVANNCTSAASGSALYTIPTSDRNVSQHLGQGYLYTNIQYSTYNTDSVDVVLGSGAEQIKNLGPIIALFLIVPFIIFGRREPSTLVVMSIVGLSVVVWSGFLYASWGVIMSIIVLGGALIYKLSR
jgi:hypothetical protein